MMADRKRQVKVLSPLLVLAGVVISLVVSYVWFKAGYQEAMFEPRPSDQNELRARLLDVGARELESCQVTGVDRDRELMFAACGRLFDIANSERFSGWKMRVSTAGSFAWREVSGKVDLVVSRRVLDRERWGGLTQAENRFSR